MSMTQDDQTPLLALNALRAKIEDFKRGTVVGPDADNDERLEVRTIQKTLNVVLTELDAALDAMPTPCAEDPDDGDEG